MNEVTLQLVAVTPMNGGKIHAAFTGGNRQPNCGVRFAHKGRVVGSHTPTADDVWARVNCAACLAGNQGR
jgi:hypothetical protein